MKIRHKSFKIILIIFATINLTSCILFDNGTDDIIDDFKIIWIDLHENRAIYDEKNQLVPAYVFSAGHDDNYIFAKQYPLLKNSKEIIDKTIINYYIINRTKKESEKKIIIGPINETEFKLTCKKFGINNPDFDLNYPTNLKF